MAFNSANMSAAALGVRMIGAYAGAKGARAGFQADARAAELNAQRARIAAEDALKRGEFDYGRLTQEAGQLKGTQRARLAANGIDLANSDLADNLQASTDFMAQTDGAMILANAMREAAGLQTGAANFENEALAARAGAKGASPWGAAAGEFVGGFGQVAEKWRKSRSSGSNQRPRFRPRQTPQFRLPASPYSNRG